MVTQHIPSKLVKTESRNAWMVGRRSTQGIEVGGEAAGVKYIAGLELGSFGEDVDTL